MGMARLVTTATLLAAALCAQAAGKGYLGISVAVEGEGVLWDPTLKSARIAKVAPGSPAARAGIAEGDVIVEIQGRPVAGAKAKDLQPHMDRGIGQTIHLVLRKPSGALEPVSVVAGPPPRP